MCAPFFKYTIHSSRIILYSTICLSLIPSVAFVLYRFLAFTGSLRTVDFRVVYSHAPPPDDGASKYNSDYITYKSDGYKSGGYQSGGGGGGGGYKSESGVSDYDPSSTVGGVEAQVSPP